MITTAQITPHTRCTRTRLLNSLGLFREDQQQQQQQQPKKKEITSARHLSTRLPRLVFGNTFQEKLKSHNDSSISTQIRRSSNGGGCQQHQAKGKHKQQQRHLVQVGVATLLYCTYNTRKGGPPFFETSSEEHVGGKTFFPWAESLFRRRDPSPRGRSLTTYWPRQPHISCCRRDRFETRPVDAYCLLWKLMVADHGPLLSKATVND